jgi:hypothetical protein
MGAVKDANLALRFGLELAVLAVLGAWGLHAGGSWGEKAALALAAPALAALGWGLFVSPKARVKVHPAGAILVEAAVFGVAMLALMAMDRPLLATALGVLAVVSRSIKVLFDLRS